MVAPTRRTVPKSHRSSGSLLFWLWELPSALYNEIKDSYELVVIASLFAVIGLISTLCLPPFMSLNELGKIVRLLCHPDEFVFQEISGGRTLGGY